MINLINNKKNKDTIILNDINDINIMTMLKLICNNQLTIDNILNGTYNFYDADDDIYKYMNDNFNFNLFKFLINSSYNYSGNDISNYILNSKPKSKVFIDKKITNKFKYCFDNNSLIDCISIVDNDFKLSSKRFGQLFSKIAKFLPFDEKEKEEYIKKIINCLKPALKDNQLNIIIISPILFSENLVDDKSLFKYDLSHEILNEKSFTKYIKLLKKYNIYDDFIKEICIDLYNKEVIMKNIYAARISHYLVLSDNELINKFLFDIFNFNYDNNSSDLIENSYEASNIKIDTNFYKFVLKIMNHFKNEKINENSVLKIIEKTR